MLDSELAAAGALFAKGEPFKPHVEVDGRLVTGQHLMHTPDTPLANLWMTMLDAFGTPVPRFADSTGVVPGMLRA